MVYDLEERTKQFANDVRAFVRRLKRDVANDNDAKQLIRASGSVGANYIEANEALGKKDFLMRVRISRKEAKECGCWLDLLEISEAQRQERDRLRRESVELMKIFGAIVRKSE